MQASGTLSGISQINLSSVTRIFIALIFLLGVMAGMNLYLGTSAGGGTFLIVAAMVGGYMATNIGANDVANAIGPLAAINDAFANGGVSAKATIPFWVLGVGAVGIAVGLALYGPKLIRTVGSEITHLNKMRAFCVALAAAITVIVASQLGLPVSSTHIAVGGVCGVGFLREYLNANRARIDREIGDRIKGDDAQAVSGFLGKFRVAAFADKGSLIKQLRKNGGAQLYLDKKDRRNLSMAYREELVKHSLLVKIAAAWVITVPASGLLAALMFFMIRGFMLP